MSDSATSLPHARRRDATATVGMTIFLGAIAMLFAALFFAYAVVRAQAPAWPPQGQAPLPRGALGLNTMILIVASIVLRAAQTAARHGDLRRARARAGAAFLLGGAFLGAQILVWRGLVSAGVGPASGIYGSVFFAISGFHALHVGGGLVALAALVLDRRAFAPGASPRREITEAPVARRLHLCALYWDFVLVVWVLFYLGACLQ